MLPLLKFEVSGQCLLTSMPLGPRNRRQEYGITTNARSGAGIRRQGNGSDSIFPRQRGEERVDRDVYESHEEEEIDVADQNDEWRISMYEYDKVNAVRLAGSGGIVRCMYCSVVCWREAWRV